MRKRIIQQGDAGHTPAEAGRLDLAKMAQVELTSEDPAHPIESALQAVPPGWLAAQPGAQLIRLRFDAPQRVRQIALAFYEGRHARTQEFSLHWSADGGQSYREIVRQQYTFSPPGTTRQQEQYTVNLDGVTAIELRITPDIGGGPGLASLAALAIS
jgi:hypothetical protein